MNLKKLFSFLILSTAVPFSASYAMEENYGVHAHGVRLGDAGNSAEGDVNDQMREYKMCATFTQDVHDSVVEEIEALRSLTKTRKKPDTLQIASTKERLRKFINDGLQYVPSRESSGLATAVGETQWSRLALMASAIQSRTNEPDLSPSIVKQNTFPTL